MLFETLKLPDASTKMCLFHTTGWPIQFSGNLSDLKLTSYFSEEKKAIVADPSSCQPCDVHNEYLIYLFYGRPAYRWNSFPPYPVLFVFSRDNSIHPNKIYPFDSDAFHEKLYGDAFSFDDLSKYLLYSDGHGIGGDDIAKLIDAIWGSKTNYYWGIVPDESQRLDTQQFNFLSELDKEYLQFIYAGPNGKGKYGKADTRAFTIEIIVRDELPLNNLEKILFPNTVTAEIAIQLRRLFSKLSGHSVEVEILPGDPTMSFKEIDKAGEKLII